MEQQNKYRVIVSERATQMLISHAAFLAQVSPEAAERLTAEFEKTANSLELMPQNIFVLVESSTWTSRPITTSYSIISHLPF